MRSLYREYFFIPSDGKIRDKVLTTRIITGVLVVLLCVFSMSITAYAFFSDNVSSASGMLQSANFELEIHVKKGSADGEDVSVTREGFEPYRIQMEANTVYFVELKKAENSNAKTGFAILTAEGCDVTYHTQQIGLNGDEVSDFVTLQVKASADTCLSIRPSWGTSTYYVTYRDSGIKEDAYLFSGDLVLLSLPGQSQSEAALNDEKQVDPLPGEKEEEPITEPKTEEME